MSAPTFDQEQIDDMLLDDDDCPNCDGSGFVDSCFEDTCVCVDPPCHYARCDWCNHDGRRSHNQPAVDPSHGEERQPKPAGPLLKIMEDEA